MSARENILARIRGAQGKPGAEPTAAVLLGPGDADPTALGQLCLPATTLGHLVGQTLVARREPCPVGRRQVFSQPHTQAVPEVRLVGGRAEVHAVILA